MNDNNPSPEKPISTGGWIAIAVLAVMLAWAVWYAIRGWGALSGVGISPFGWVMLALGVIVTTLVGGGLMALLFYSSRKNFDQ
jgi:hypothetical protein